MKRVIFIFCLMLLCGCGTKHIAGYKNVQEKLMAMESYCTNAHITYINNKGSDEFDATYYATKDGKYRMELTAPEDYKDNVIMFDGKMVWSYNPAVEQKVSVDAPDKPQRYELVLFSFLENYVKSQNVTVQSASLDESLCTVLEAEIPGENQFFATEKLCINNETQNPQRLIIYDNEGNEKIKVDFTNFQYNCEIEPEKFTINK